MSKPPSWLRTLQSGHPVPKLADKILHDRIAFDHGDIAHEASSASSGYSLTTVDQNLADMAEMAVAAALA
jgi:hypothetical protein